MDNGRKSYFTTNKNNSSNSVNEVEIEIKELELEGDGKVSGDVGTTPVQSDTLNDNSSQQPSDSSNNISNSSDTVSDNNLSQGEDNQSDDSTDPVDDLSDGMEDVSDDSEENNPEKKKDDESQKKDDDSEKKDDKSEDDKKEQPDKQKLDENKKDQENNGDEQTKQKDENPTEKDNQPKEDNNSSSNENNSSSSDEDKPTESKESSSSEKEQSSSSSDGEKKDSKEDGSKQKNESSEKDNKSPNSGKKDNSSRKDEQKGGLPKNNRNGRSPQDIKNNLKNRLNPKNIGKNAFNRTKLGQNINKAKNAVNNAKKAVNATKKVAKGVAKAGKAAVNAVKGLLNLIISTMPWSLIVIVVVAIIAIIIGASVAILPGSGDNVTEGTSNYSDVDQKTLEKMQTLFKKYPNADGTLAMAVVLYPYYEVLYGGETNDHLNLSTDEESEDIEDDTELDDEPEEGDADIEDGDEDSTNNDIYLEPFRKLKVRNKLKTVLKKLNNSSEEEFNQYLKDNYFKKDKGYAAYDGNGFNGYKKMFDSVPSDKRDALADAIIEDLYEKKEVFINYVYEAYSCTSDLQSAGTVEIDDMLKGNILVDVKVPSCTSASNVWSCQSMYPSPITLKQYTLGGAYAEYSSMDVEKTAAQMLAIKSYIVDRSKSMGWGIKTDQNGNYVVTARNNTNDLVYCDIEAGCNGAVKRGTISEQQRDVYEKAWEKIADKYIYDKDAKKTVGAFCLSRSGVCDFCKKGSCLAHQELDNYTNTSYDTIIGMQYSDYAMIQVEGDFANVTIAAGSNCSGTTALDIDDSNFVYYAQTDYENVGFCGRTKGGAGDGLCPIGSTICTSGCGLTSVAMVTATLTQNYSINPLTLNNEVRVGTDCGPGIPGSNGGSMFPYVASKYGLSVTSKAVNSNTINDIKQGIDEGGLIIASVCGGLRWENKTYTKPSKSCGGHFIVVRGYEGDSVVISDPYQNNTLKNFSNCLVKKDGKCIKHKLDFNTFYNDLRVKNGYLYIIKGQTPFYELKNQTNVE